MNCILNLKKTWLRLVIINILTSLANQKPLQQPHFLAENAHLQSCNTHLRIQKIEIQGY